MTVNRNRWKSLDCERRKEISGKKIRRVASAKPYGSEGFCELHHKLDIWAKGAVGVLRMNCERFTFKHRKKRRRHYSGD